MNDDAPNIAAVGAAGDSALRAALRELLDKLDAIRKDERYKSVWFINQIHVGPYTGPNYEAEYNAARAALSVGAYEGANGGNAGASHVSTPAAQPEASTTGEAQASADPKVWAQHDETGRLWIGLRSKLPPRYTEYHPTAAALPEAPAPAPIAWMYRSVDHTYVTVHRRSTDWSDGYAETPLYAQVGAVSAGPPREPTKVMINVGRDVYMNTPAAAGRDGWIAAAWTAMWDAWRGEQTADPEGASR